MAYNIHWKIKFRVLNSNQLLTVNIWKKGALPTGYPLTLTGAQAPFSTQEDDNEDLFQPIRTQSGYLRIVDDGTALNSSNTSVSFNWKDLLPSTDTDRPVTLTDSSNNILWQGFMQAQNFSGSLYGGTQVREFPVQCVITALSSADVGFNTDIKNFAYVIKTIFDQLTNTAVDISNYIFQGDTYALQWLQKKVDWQNFITQNANGELNGKYDLLTMLEDVCRFWGWTARTYGTNVIFTRPDNTSLSSYITLTKSQIATLASGGTVSVSAVSAPSVTPTGDIFASTEIDDFMERGAHKATVSANANSDTPIIEFAPESLQETWGQDSTDNEIYDNVTVHYININSFPGSGRVSPYLNGMGVTNQGAMFAFAQFSQRVSSSLQRNDDDKYVLRFTNSYNGSSMLKLYSTFQHSFSNGIIKMYGNIYSGGNKLVEVDKWDVPRTYTMKMKLGIGLTRLTAKWWNGSAWQNSETEFTAGICSSDGLIWNVTTHSSGQSYSNRGIYTDSGMAGLIFIDFCGSENLPDFDGRRRFLIDGFKLTYETSGSRNLEVPKGGMSEMRDYVATNAYMTRDEWNCDTIYASQNWLNFGYGVVMNSDYTLMDSANFGPSLAMFPEQHLANRVVNFWATAKRMIRADLWNSDSVVGAITPRHYVTIDGTRLHPFAISHEWRDDVVTMSLLEIPT